MSGAPAVVGIADHSGWAWFLSVIMEGATPRLIDRRRVEILAPDLPRQPHHHEAQDIDLVQVEALVAKVKASALKLSQKALKALRDDLAPEYDLIGIGRRADPVRPVPDTVAGILASHPAMHAADGVLYRHALDEAARQLGVEITVVPRKQEMDFGASSLGMEPDQFQRLVAEVGKKAGAPWQKEQRAAFALAIAILQSM